jgi:hypothetical protein
VFARGSLLKQFCRKQYAVSSDLGTPREAALVLISPDQQIINTT